MKILLIGNGNGLSETLGGSLVRIIEIFKRLQNENQITFLTTIGCLKACRKEGLNVNFEIVRASFGRTEEKNLIDRLIAYCLSTIFSLIKILNLPEYDVLCIYSDYFCDVFPAVFYKQVKKSPLIAMVHHKISVSRETFFTFVMSSLSSKMQEISFIFLRYYADKVLVYNSDMGIKIQNELVRRGFSPNDIIYVDNGVDIELINNIQPANRKYDACFIGGIRPNKGLYDIVSIWKKVIIDYKFNLVIIGKGLNEYENYLKKQISNAKLENLILLEGSKTREETISILKASKIFFFPSHEEGWGIAVCEALACKKPVIAYDLPVYKRIFGDSIFYIPCWNIDFFSEKVLDILKTKNLNDIGLKNYNISLKYNWNRIAEREYKIIKDVAEGKNLIYKDNDM